MGICPESFKIVQHLLAEHAANELSDDKQYLVETRLAPIAREHGFDSVDDFASSLRTRPTSRLQRAVIEAMLITETFFFRDPRSFRYFEETVLPELCQARQAQRRLRIWSAACASGQELYSVAIALAERMPHVAASWNVRLVGSDASTSMVDRARRGVYSAMELNRGPAPERVRRHVEAIGNAWRVSHRLRSLVEFCEWNLADGTLTAQWDVIFLRNVLIYFSADFRYWLFDRIHQSLRPDGFLFLGASETAQLPPELFHRAAPDSLACFRRM